MSIRDKLLHVHEAIGERPVTLVAVTKYAAIEQMAEAYAAGIRHFGENKVQEALKKMEAFPADRFPGLQWHLIGSLQSNKVKKTVGRFALIHSVDSLKLAKAIAMANAEAQASQPIMLQVNFSDDVARHGFLPHETASAAAEANTMRGLQLQGLMTMAPHTQDTAVLKSVFCGLREIREAIHADHGIDLPDLSMGMSNDFPHALECGATIIRIGNYLFQN